MNFAQWPDQLSIYLYIYYILYIIIYVHVLNLHVFIFLSMPRCKKDRAWQLQSLQAEVARSRHLLRVFDEERSIGW